MADQSSQVRDPVEVLAEEFLDRRRRGEYPSLTEYTDHYPHLAGEIRDVFPALLMMDEIDPHSAELGRSTPGPVIVGSPPPAAQLGDYRILREVGQGGMGIVYEAVQESLGRRVALKVLLPAISSRARFRERFQREARAAARLHHTNIVPVFGVGEDQHVLYYAMQFIQGQGLDAVLRDVKRIRGQVNAADLADAPTMTRTHCDVAHSLLSGRFEQAPQPTLSVPAAPPAPPPPDPSDVGTRSELSNQPEARYYRGIALLGVQAAEGLAHAHAQGILHRDIKPSNLLLDAHGTLWITDFGLAKTEEGDDLTHSGEVIGTLRYVPPERFEGKNDVRSDIYSLGVTLYEMLTLCPPFRSTDRLNLMSQITTETPVPPGRLAPHLPRDLETIVQKAMAREPAIRYATAHDLADELRRFLENRTIKARRSTPTELFRRWCRRNPAVASLIGAVLLLLVCLTAGSLAAAIQLNRKEADRTEKLYESLVAQASASRYSRRVGQRFDTLAAVRKAADLVRERHMPPERLDHLRTLAIAGLALPDLRLLRSGQALGDAWQSVVADDQLRFYARVEDNGQISVRRVNTDEEIARLDGPRPAPSLQFSPGGRFLSAFVNHRILAWDLSQNPPPLVLDCEGYDWAFHPDGRHLLIRRRDGAMHLHDLTAPQDKFVVLSARMPVGHMVLDPAGERLAVADGRQVQVVDVQTGKRLLAFSDSAPVYFLAWHPSGNYLAVVCSEHEIHVWDMKRNVLLADLKGCRNAGVSVRFSPDRERLLSWGFDGMVRVWDWRTGREMLQMPGGVVQLGADGRVVIAQGRQFGVYEFASGRERRSIVRQSNVSPDLPYWGAAVHPGGRVIAVPSTDAARIFDCETGEEVASLPPTGFARTFTANGDLLTDSPSGVVRWPVGPAGDAYRWRVGPPEKVYAGHCIDLSCDATGDVIGLAVSDGALILRPGRKPLPLRPHADCRHINISPDGKLAATGNHGGEDGVNVWNTETGELLTRFPVGGSCSGAFTADGRRMFVMGTRGCFVVQVGAWEKGPADQWTGFGGFSPDGRIVVTFPDRGTIRFEDAATGREIVRFDDPDGNFGNVVFTPDGARLICSSDVAESIHVWDLRSLCVQLAELGLDWDQPPLPPPVQDGPVRPLQVDVDYGPLDPKAPARDIGLNSFILALYPFDLQAYLNRARAYGRTNDLKKAEADLTVALALMPPDHKNRGEALMRGSLICEYGFKDKPRAAADLEEIAQRDLPLTGTLAQFGAQECNNLAWQYATGPEPQRDLAKASMLIGKAVRLDPDERTLMNTQGVVYYRLGQYPQAIEWLTRSLKEGKGEAAAHDLFFLAMCHAKLGETAKAKDCYDRAVRWVEEHGDHLAHPSWAAELKGFRAEAEAALAAGKSAAHSP